MDKRKVRNNSWLNLIKGPKAMSDKYKSLRKEKTCPNCNKTFDIPISQNRKIFCCQKCKNEGQTKGLTKPMRLGTGMSSERKNLYSKWARYRNNDKNKGYTFDYELEEFRDLIMNSKCVYCNRKEWLGLDRINNKKGHSKDNTNVCCELCNSTRGNRFSVDEMKVIGKAIESLNIGDRRHTKQNENNFFRKQKQIYDQQ